MTYDEVDYAIVDEIFDAGRLRVMTDIERMPFSIPFSEKPPKKAKAFFRKYCSKRRDEINESEILLSPESLARFLSVVVEQKTHRAFRANYAEATYPGIMLSRFSDEDCFTGRAKSKWIKYKSSPDDTFWTYECEHCSSSSFAPTAACSCCGSDMKENGEIVIIEKEQL